MTSKFADIQPGDELWVINSRFNSVFEANVVSAQDGVIMVEVPAKRADYTFNWETGEALDGGSILAFDGDWRVKTILLRKEHLAKHTAVISAASAFQKNPTQANAEAMINAATEWARFAGSAGDYWALVSPSLHEYAVKTPGGASFERRSELGIVNPNRRS